MRTLSSRPVGCLRSAIWENYRATASRKRKRAEANSEAALLKVKGLLLTMIVQCTINN